MLDQRLTAIFPTELSAFPWANAAMWLAVGGTIATAVLFDVVVALSWAATLWAKLMDEISR
jgi:hypothetical protein